MPRSFAKSKKKFKKISELLESRDFVDVGEMEVVTNLKEIPNGVDSKFESDERRFGCLPWRLELRKMVEPPDGAGARDACMLKASLRCSYRENTWTAKASGILTMEKWPEKVKGRIESEHKSPHVENFSRIFNQQVSIYEFMHRFPIPSRNRMARGGMNPADSPYLRNGQFKFRLQIVVHSVRKVQFPFYDFLKKTPMCNAVVKVRDNHDKELRFNVNKEYLSMYSETLNRMFNNSGFLEGRTNEVVLPNIDSAVFCEFLNVIYPSQQRPQIRYIRGLLEFARMYFIPTVTAKCEQRLLEAEDAEISKCERLKLADQYGLLHLLSKIMQNLTLKDVPDLEGFSPELLQMLVRRQKNCPRNRDETDEPMDVDQAAGSSSNSAARHRAPQHRVHRAGLAARGRINARAHGH